MSSQPNAEGFSFIEKICMARRPATRLLCFFFPLGPLGKPPIFHQASLAQISAVFVLAIFSFDTSKEVMENS